jgi:hypothetical protein
MATRSRSRALEVHLRQAQARPHLAWHAWRPRTFSTSPSRVHRTSHNVPPHMYATIYHQKKKIKDLGKKVPSRVRCGGGEGRGRREVRCVTTRTSSASPRDRDRSSSPSHHQARRASASSVLARAQLAARACARHAESPVPCRPTRGLQPLMRASWGERSPPLLPPSPRDRLHASLPQLKATPEPQWK